MNLGFIARNDLDGLKADAQFAKDHGFEGLELNYWDQFEGLTDGIIAEMRTILDGHGIRAAMLGLWGWNHLSPDAAEREKAHTMLNRAIDFAQALGAELFVSGGGDMPDEPIDRKIDDFLKVYPPFLDRISEAGLKHAFYPLHGASFFDGIETFESVWQHLPDITIKFDPANWCHSGHDYLDVLRRHGDKIGYAHIKEHIYHDGALASQPAAGMGDIQWGKVFAYLYEHTYTGWLSIEPHGPLWGDPGPLHKHMLLLSQRYIQQFLV